MNWKMIEHLLAFMLVMQLLTGCAAAGPALIDGQVLALQPQTTLAGIRAALAGAPETVVMWKDGVTLTAWPQSGGWGFAVLNCNCGDPIGAFNYVTGGKGNWIPAARMSDLELSLRQLGWEKVSGGLSSGLTAASQAAQGMGQAMIGILVVPVGILPAEALLPQG